MWMIREVTADKDRSLIGRGVCQFTLTQAEREVRMPFRWQILDTQGSFLVAGIADRDTVGPLMWAQSRWPTAFAIEFWRASTGCWEPVTAESIHAATVQ
jgi:hypothetical protein